MPWNEADRVKYEVIRARYSSDMSEAELALIAPLLPPKRRGRKPTDAQLIWRESALRIAILPSTAPTAGQRRHRQCRRALIRDQRPCGLLAVDQSGSRLADG